VSLVLNRLPHQLDEAVLFLVLTQLLFELWCEQFEQFDVPSHKWSSSIGGAEKDRVARGAANTLQPKFRSSRREFGRRCTYSTRSGLSCVPVPWRAKEIIQEKQ
jgi:hypothetical protein